MTTIMLLLLLSLTHWCPIRRAVLCAGDADWHVKHVLALLLLLPRLVCLLAGVGRRLPAPPLFTATLSSSKRPPPRDCRPVCAIVTFDFDMYTVGLAPFPSPCQRLPRDGRGADFCIPSPTTSYTHAHHRPLPPPSALREGRS